MKQRANHYRDKIDKAIDMLIQYGGIDGAHHKTWVIDQTLRILAGRRYAKITKDSEEDGMYEPWDEGIAP